MASFNRFHSVENIDDNEGFDHDDDEYRYFEFETIDNFALPDDLGRVKSKKQAHKFAKRSRY